MSSVPFHKLLGKGVQFTMDKKEINQIVGTNIKREREKAGYTQERFSEMIGIGAKSLSAVERGVVGVSLTTLIRICELLSVSTGTILLAPSAKNDLQGITEQLEHLSPEQFEIARSILCKLMEAFSCSEK